ncbi:MAG TPA: hypothetical protein VGC57_17180 [Cellulomonas sp.]
MAAALVTMMIGTGAVVAAPGPASAASCATAYSWKAKNASCSFSIKHTLVFAHTYIQADAASRGHWSTQLACYDHVVARGWARA